MSQGTPKTRSPVAAVAGMARELARRATNVRRRRADAHAKAICPVDSWAFTPLYTGGSCPLCGWTPTGYEYHPPILAPYERFWGALAGIVATSVAMAVAVGLAYSQF